MPPCPSCITDGGAFRTCSACAAAEGWPVLPASGFVAYTRNPPKNPPTKRMVTAFESLRKSGLLLINPKQSGSYYKDTHERDPQFIETATYPISILYGSLVRYHPNSQQTLLGPSPLASTLGSLGRGASWSRISLASGS